MRKLIFALMGVSLAFVAVNELYLWQTQRFSFLQKQAGGQVASPAPSLSVEQSAIREKMRAQEKKVYELEQRLKKKETDISQIDQKIDQASSKPEQILGDENQQVLLTAARRDLTAIQQQEQQQLEELRR